MVLQEEDRRVLDHVRAALPRWLALVDRVTPVEVLETVLREAAYAFEIRGPRRGQARENLKKLRALVRRIQNRGYATLARIADHLDQLALGDELAVTPPPNGFGTHDYEPGRMASLPAPPAECQQLIERRVELGRFHVIRVTAEPFVPPGHIRRIGPRLAQAAQPGEMTVDEAFGRQRRRQRVTREMRVAA